MNKYISIFEYAKKHNTSKQNVYRWIREHKFNEEDIKKVVLEVRRIRIKDDARVK